jgi:hypothetical protein
MKAMDAPAVPAVWNHPPRREWTRAERERELAKLAARRKKWIEQ